MGTIGDRRNMGTRLYVGNLAFSATSETVREAFAAFGSVQDVHVVTDRESGRSRVTRSYALGGPTINRQCTA